MLDFLNDLLVIEGVMFLHYELENNSELVIAYQIKDGTFVDYTLAQITNDVLDEYFDAEKS